MGEINGGKFEARIKKLKGCVRKILKNVIDSKNFSTIYFFFAVAT